MSITCQYCVEFEARFNSGANFTTLPETRITEVARIVRCNHFVRFVICCCARTNKQANAYNVQSIHVKSGSRKINKNKERNNDINRSLGNSQLEKGSIWNMSLFSTLITSVDYDNLLALTNI